MPDDPTAAILGCRAWARSRRYSSAACPRIECPIEKIGQEIDADEDRADDDGSPEYGVHVGVLQRIGDVEPEPRPGEDGLRQPRPFQQARIRKRSDERRGGTECDSTYKPRWWS